MQVRQLVAVGAKVTSRYQVECWRRRDARGRFVTPYLAWREDIRNLVTTEGLNTLLARSFDAVAGDVNWFVGVKTAGAAAAGDTMASHAGWAESTVYSNANRPTWTKNGAPAAVRCQTARARRCSTSAGGATLTGAVLTSNNTKGGTTGLLNGAAEFAASRAVLNGDTLNVQVDLSVAAA
jgi:hypothetical protein